MNKFEKLIEYIINDEDQKARELFHAIVVEKSRDIYESIMDQESCDEEVAGDQVGDMVDEISHEETVGEGEDEFGGDELGGDDMGGEEDFGGEDDFGGEEDFGGEDELGGDEVGGDIGDQVMGIDAKLDELLAKFDEIMGDEEGPSDEVGGEEDFGGDEEVGDAEGGEDFGGEEGGEEIAEAFSGKSGKSGSAKSGVSGKSGSAKSGKSGKSGKSSAEMMREYVDRIGDIYGGKGDAAEGTAVGAAGKKTSVNTKPGSVGPGADFGGSNKNIARGGSEADANGKQIPKPSNEYNKGQGTIKSGNVNVPGGIKGKPQKSTGEEYSKASPKDGSGVGAGKSIGPQNQKSVQKQNTGKKQ